MHKPTFHQNNSTELVQNPTSIELKESDLKHFSVPVFEPSGNKELNEQSYYPNLNSLNKKDIRNYHMDTQSLKSDSIPIRSSSTIINRFLDAQKPEKVLSHKGSFAGSLNTNISDFSHKSSTLSLLEQDEINAHVNLAMDSYINSALLTPKLNSMEPIAKSSSYFKKPSELLLNKDSSTKNTKLIEERNIKAESTNFNNLENKQTLNNKSDFLSKLPFGARMFCGGLLFFPLFYVGSFYKVNINDKIELEWRGYNRVLAGFVTIVLILIIVLLIHGLISF